MRKTLERIRKSYSFSENDLKHEITLAKNLPPKESKLRTSFEKVFSFIAILLKKLRLTVTGSHGRPQRGGEMGICPPLEIGSKNQNF